ncbi:MAG TPA: alkyl hydroperoxide reductase [Myxococcales bacterium]|jgi:alkyl hydroperoxide reductase subunit AhpC|nr:alkyl hydroperoxide reductase [Myxococcales bacterium]
MPSYEGQLPEFTKRNAQVVGISCDSHFSNEAWAKSIGGLSYPLLSDFWPHGKVCVDYGVLRPGGVCERAIFVVDGAGVIRYIDIHDINEQPPAKEILKALDRLQ